MFNSTSHDFIVKPHLTIWRMLDEVVINKSFVGCSPEAELEQCRPNELINDAEGNPQCVNLFAVSTQRARQNTMMRASLLLLQVKMQG